MSADTVSGFPACRLCGRDIHNAPMFRVTVERLTLSGGSNGVEWKPVETKPAMMVHKQCADALERTVGTLSEVLRARESATRNAGS